MESKVDKGVDEQDADFEKKLLSLHCPFTWDMTNIEKSTKSDYHPHDDEEAIPILKLLRSIMDIFLATKDTDDPKVILNDMKDCDKALKEIERDNCHRCSIKMLKYVLNGTKCHVYWRIDHKTEARELFEKLELPVPENKFEMSSITAFRSMCWSQFHRLGTEEAIDFIKKALEDNPNCDLYQFILAKNLRRMRRDASVGSKPSAQEEMAFRKAYETSKNETFGMYLAQMYRELNERDKALRMYLEIYHSKPKSVMVHLRLALGFIQLFKFKEADACLKIVAKEHSDSGTYLHYMGMFYMKQKKFVEAVAYLKKSADQENYAAARGYMRCMKILNPSYDPTAFMLQQKEMYKNMPEKQIQTLLLDLALNYLNMNKLGEAMKHFLHCIEIDPQNRSLTGHYPFDNPGRETNIYFELAKRVFPRIEMKRRSLDDETLRLNDELKVHYDKYKKEQMDQTCKIFSLVQV